MVKFFRKSYDTEDQIKKPKGWYYEETYCTTSLDLVRIARVTSISLGLIYLITIGLTLLPADTLSEVCKSSKGGSTWKDILTNPCIWI